MGNKAFPVVVAIAVVGGCVVLILGGCFIPVFKQRTIKDLNRHVLPVKGSESFERWKTWTHFKPVFRYFYFFHVVNPSEIVRTGKGATLQERGPYVYSVHFERRDVSFNANGTRLSYRLYKKYSFERTLSVGNDSDVITLVNLPILNLATRLRFSKDRVRKCVRRQVNATGDGGLFSRIRVSDVLWGYKHSVLESVLKRCGITLLKDTTYGLMYQTGQPRRTTFEGSFEASTAVKRLWEIKKWNGKSSLDAWKPKSECNELKGTDGYSWPPHLVRGQPQFIFDAEWCRWIKVFPLRKNPMVTIDGIQTFAYSYLGLSFIKTGVNKCFCHPLPIVSRSNSTHCLEKGVVNVTSCKDNVPLVLSQPHFLGASIAYFNFRGLNADVKKHSTRFYMEPISGELVEASRKIQLNAFVLHLSSFQETKKQPKFGYPFPVVWMKEEYTMSDGEKALLKRQVLNRREEYKIIYLLMISFGSTLIFLSLGVFIVFQCRQFQSKVSRSSAAERRPLLK